MAKYSDQRCVWEPGCKKLMKSRLINAADKGKVIVPVSVPVPVSLPVSGFRILAVFICALVVPMALAQSQTNAEPAAGASASVTLNFQDADIRALITTVSQITGKKFYCRSPGQGQGDPDLRWQAANRSDL